MPDECPVAQILAAEGIADAPQALRELSAAALQRLLAFTSSGKLTATRVITNLIWQAYTAIRDGQRAPIAGNLRSFWSTDLKPVRARLGGPVEGRRATELVYDAFVELGPRHHLCHYHERSINDTLSSWTARRGKARSSGGRELDANKVAEVSGRTACLSRARHWGLPWIS